MIVFNLNCTDCNFEFEGWFDNSIEFEKQNKKKLINCPSCNSSLIKKFLMTPNVSSKSNAKKSLKIKKHLLMILINLKKL